MSLLINSLYNFVDSVFIAINHILPAFSATTAAIRGVVTVGVPTLRIFGAAFFASIPAMIFAAAIKKLYF